MSEVISDKDYIRLILRGQGKCSTIKVTPESVNICSEKIKIQEDAIND